MILHHGGLDSMQFTVFRQILDGYEFRSVNLTQEENAGIDRLVMHTAAFDAPKRYGARAAIALRAAFLGADLAFLEP
jgi:hypothetical protein